MTQAINKHRMLLLAATALASALTPSFAHAQVTGSAAAAAADNENNPTSQQPTTTTQGAADDLADVREIVVTAQFRSQNLQQTPLAITAITGDQLQAKGVVNMQDLTRVAPSVNLRHTGSAGGKTLAAFIRGIGASDYNFGIEPGVAFYIDDVYLGPSYGTLIDFIDLERVEVLRGPQGTLSGKNALGGAIRLITAKPQGTNSGYIESEYGSRHLLRFRAAYDLKLTDTLFMRVSGFSANQNGLVRLLDFGCVNPTLVGNTAAPYTVRDVSPGHSCDRDSLGNTDVRAARLQFRWQPTDNLEINLAGDYVDDNAKGAADVLLFVDPAGFANYRSPLQPAGTAPFFQYYYGVPYDTRFLPPKKYTSYATFEDKVYNQKFPNKNTLSVNAANLNIAWKINDQFSLSSVTGFRVLQGQWSYDSDSSPLATDGVYDTQNHKQYTQEVRLSGSMFDDRLNFTVGGFYYHGNEGDQTLVEAVPFNFHIYINSEPESTNYAGFVHGEFKLTDQLTLIGGLRQSHENKTYRFIEHDSPGTPGNSFPGGFDYPAKTSYDRTDYRAGLQFQITPEHMIYANIATGFRGGGFNPRPSNPQTATSFAPEQQTSYELGQRSEFFDRRVRWNNTFYYSDFKDIILSGRITSIVSGGAFPVTVVTNAAKAHIYGWESELQATVSDYLSLNGAASYTKFKYDDLGVAAALSATTGPTLQSTQRYTPKWKFNLGVQATLPILEDLGKTTFNFDYAYQTKQYPDARNLEPLKIPAYGVGNARITFATLESGWSISGFVSNIFNKYYFYNKNFISGNFQMKGNPAPGREASITLKKTF